MKNRILKFKVLNKKPLKLFIKNNQHMLPIRNEFSIKQNDTYPFLQVCLVDETCLGQPIDFNLSAATAVTFSMTDSYGNYKISNKDSIITNYSGGSFEYRWNIEDTEESGNFKGEFKIYFSGYSMSIPQNGYININIIKEI